MPVWKKLTSDLFTCVSYWCHQGMPRHMILLKRLWPGWASEWAQDEGLYCIMLFAKSIHWTTIDLPALIVTCNELPVSTIWRLMSTVFWSDGYYKILNVACTLFREINTSAKLKGVNIDTVPTIIHVICCFGIVQFEFAKIKGAKIILYVKSPTFRAAKLKVFTVTSPILQIVDSLCLKHHTGSSHFAEVGKKLATHLEQFASSIIYVSYAGRGTTKQVSAVVHLHLLTCHTVYIHLHCCIRWWYMHFCLAAR